MDYFNDISVKVVAGETHLQIVAKKACKIIKHLQIFLQLQDRKKHQQNATQAQRYGKEKNISK